MDGVRALLHIEDGSVRITSRTVSEVTYRLSEFQDNLPHLTKGVAKLNGTILDGELVSPVSALDTGSTITGNSLQATMAILTAAPSKAQKFQDDQHAHVRFHVFDILRSSGKDVMLLPLMDRQDILATTLRSFNNTYTEPVPSFVVNKPDIHRRIIDAGGEGTVWKKADSPYEPGRRVGHWIKRKRGVEVEAFVTGFKPGNNGHAHVIGAVEFSILSIDGTQVSVAWVSGWSDHERHAMTMHDADGVVCLNPDFIGRPAVLVGQDESARSRRLRHARLKQWAAS